MLALDASVDDHHNRMKKNAVNLSEYRWTDQRVPYEISDEFSKFSKR